MTVYCRGYNFAMCTHRRYLTVVVFFLSTHRHTGHLSCFNTGLRPGSFHSSASSEPWPGPKVLPCIWIILLTSWIPIRPHSTSDHLLVVAPCDQALSLTPLSKWVQHVSHWKLPYYLFFQNLLQSSHELPIYEWTWVLQLDWFVKGMQPQGVNSHLHVPFLTTQDALPTRSTGYRSNTRWRHFSAESRRPLNAHIKSAHAAGPTLIQRWDDIVPKVITGIEYNSAGYVVS